MNNLIEQLQILKDKIVFDEYRKKNIRNILIASIENEESVRMAAGVRHNSQRSQLINFIFKPLKPMPIFAILIIMTLAGGGVSMAAEGTLPGDLLYPVKVNINEEVRASLTFSEEASANWEARRAGRRLEEAQKLAAKGEVNEEVRTKLEERFGAHADRVEARIEKIQARGDINAAVDIASNFETSLKAHERILAEIEAGTEARGASSAEVKVKPLTVKIKTEIDNVIKARVRLEQRIASEDGKPETKIAAEGKLNAVGNMIASTRLFLEGREEKLGAEAVREAKAKLQVAENLIVEGRAKIETDLYGEAFNLANKAIRTAEVARLLLEAENRLNFRFKLKIGNDSASEINSSTSSGARKEDGSEDKSILEAKTQSETRNQGGSMGEAEVKSEIKIEGGGSDIKGDIKLRLDF